jgi:hypothetical protein
VPAPATSSLVPLIIDINNPKMNKHNASLPQLPILVLLAVTILKNTAKPIISSNEITLDGFEK